MGAGFNNIFLVVFGAILERLLLTIITSSELGLLDVSPDRIELTNFTQKLLRLKHQVCLT